jgi:threonine/homoserine/homoserine lactone efflux protein
LGIVVIRNAGRAIGADSRLTRPGVWAGFFAGLAAILGNPKAILFYMGVLPGFFDLSRVTAADIAVIVLISMIVPFLCNLAVALLVDRAKRRLSSPAALRRTNLVAGALLIAVGLAIPVW